MSLPGRVDRRWHGSCGRRRADRPRTLGDVRIDPRQRSHAARRPRRDRRGRGVRGGIAPRGVPINRTHSELFDDLVLDAVEELEDHLAGELADVEFAVEEVPPDPGRVTADFDSDTIADRGIPLARLYRDGVAELRQPVIVVYRRPVEARAADRDARSDLVFSLVAELVAEYLGHDL